MRTWLHLVAIVLAVSVTGCDDDSGGAPGTDLSVTADLSKTTDGASTDLRAPTTASVTVGPGGAISYSPATVTIAVGGTVTWTWAAGPHSVTSGTCTAKTCTPDAKFDSGTPQSTGTFEHTFATAGDYPYYCTVHTVSMKGMVHVQ